MVASRDPSVNAGDMPDDRQSTRLIAGSLIAACLLLAVVGCEGAPPPPPAEAPGGESIEKEAETVDVRVLDHDGIRMLVDSHRGKVVVVDYWSTTCPPCLKEFPGLVRLHEQYPRDQLRCVSVSLDYIGIADQPPESYKERVLTFLRTFNATFDNVIAGDEADVMFEKLDLASPPAVYVYRQDGSLAKRFDNVGAASEAEAFSYEDVEALVKELLSATPD
ncbi:MAG: TlpA disulfide reductase family protein [Pirellulaceae bacterium]